MELKKGSFPNVDVAQKGVFRPSTPSGMFIFRHIQADGLLNLSDLIKGDLSQEDKLELLDSVLSFCFPLKALVIFLNVVALEDFIRNLGDSLAKVKDLNNFFPKIVELGLKQKSSKPKKPSMRHDIEPVSSFTDFEAVNDLYFKCLGVKPFEDKDLPRLNDLVILRHTVAHHGSIIREIDVPRFQYYAVKANQLINPPISFVKETCSYLYSIGKKFENTIKERIFSEILLQLDNTWVIDPPELLYDLIRVFDYFGKLVESTSLKPKDDALIILEELSEDIEKKLFEACIEELKNWHSIH